MKLIQSAKISKMAREICDADMDPCLDIWVPYDLDYDNLLQACQLVEKAHKANKPIVEAYLGDGDEYIGGTDALWYVGTIKEVQKRLQPLLDEAREAAIDDEQQAIEQFADEVKRLKKELKAKEALAAKAKPKKKAKSK